jgi:hypothetical protein
MYDLAMTFCRIQEFYESPIKHIRGHKFKLLEFMATYAKTRDGVFSYPTDWGGFNIPGPVVDRLFKLGIDDYNGYDKIIEGIHNKINKEIDQPNNYYLIGSDNNKTTVEHEYCHGLYFVNKKYRDTVNGIVKQLLPAVRKKISKVLLNLGYDESVMDDEIQAYLSTGFNLIKENTKFNKRELTNFTDVVLELHRNFKTYRKKIKI